jgi:hypothetical protein
LLPQHLEMAESVLLARGGGLACRGFYWHRQMRGGPRPERAVPMPLILGNILNLLVNQKILFCH